MAANSGRTARGKGRPFQKGQSGNPSGRPKIPVDVKALIREYTPKAMQTVIALLDSENEKVAFQAAQELLNRGLGKPVQPSDVQMDVSGALDVRAQIHAALLEQAKQAKEHAE